MKLVAILRVKNEILYIRKCLKRLSELVDEIIVLDNGSTDGTLEVYNDFPKLIQLLQTEGFDEGRDKIMLLEAAKERQPDWILWLDGDEVFEKSLTRDDLNKYMNSSANKISFRLINFWMNEQDVRYGGSYFLYSIYPRPRMWRNTEGSFFLDKKIHNGEIQGISGKEYLSPFRILHYGYVNKEKVERKYDLYKQVDKSGFRTYEHIRSDIKTFCLPYIEFNSRFLNNIYIHIYKYVLSFLHILYRLYLKIRQGNLFISIKTKLLKSK